jgi:hypothetical protein
MKNIVMPPKRVRHDEVRFLNRRRRRKDARQSGVTPHGRPTAANPFQKRLVAQKQLLKMDQVCAEIMKELGFFDPLPPALAPVPVGAGLDPPSPLPDKEGGPGPAPTFWRRFLQFFGILNRYGRLMSRPYDQP